MVAGLSGAVLVFWHALEPAPPAISAGPPLPLDALLRAGRAAAPKAEPWRIFPAGADRPARLVLLPPEGGRLTLFLDPATGQVLDRQAWGDAWVHTLYDLHDGALGGRWGKLAVGLAGIALVAQALLGLVLWARRHGAPWRESLLPSAALRGLRSRRNLHRALGTWTALPLLLAGLTGVGHAFPETLRAIAHPVMPASEYRTPPLERQPVDMDGAVALALRMMPEFRLAWVNLPREKGLPWEINLRRRDGAISGRALVVIRPDGRVLLAELPRPVETLRAWIGALHNGEAGGLPHRLAIVGLGLAPLGFAITGWAMWRRRSLARATAGSRIPASGARG